MEGALFVLSNILIVSIVIKQIALNVKTDTFWTTINVKHVDQS